MWHKFVILYTHTIYGWFQPKLVSMWQPSNSDGNLGFKYCIYCVWLQERKASHPENQWRGKHILFLQQSALHIQWWTAYVGCVFACVYLLTSVSFQSYILFLLPHSRLLKSGLCTVYVSLHERICVCVVFLYALLYWPGGRGSHGRVFLSPFHFLLLLSNP